MATQSASTSITSSLASIAGHQIGMVVPTVGYDATNKGQRPPFIIRQINPMAGVLFAFAESDTITDDVKVQDDQDVDGVDGSAPVLDNTDLADDALYAISPISNILSRRVWRVINTYLKSGIGTRHNVTLASFSRYMARITFVAATVRSILNLMYLQDNYRFNDQNFGRDQVLFHRFVEDTGIHDAANQQLLEHVIAQTRGLPVFPRLINEMVRMLEPYLIDDADQTLHIPQFVPWDESAVSAGTQLQLCEEYLEYLTGSLPDTVALMSAFIPASFADTALWSTPVVGYDPIKTSGAFNSSFELLNIAGNETSPDDDENTMIVIDDPGTASSVWKPGLLTQAQLSSADGVHFYTKDDALAAMEFLSSTVWLEVRSTTPDNYMLLTPHQWGRAIIFNDDETYDVIDGANLSTALDHLAPFLNCKFPGRSDEITVKPGYQQMELELNAAMAIVGRFSEVLFHVDALQAIATAQMGRSVKFAKSEVKEIFMA
jgi:hypothetical protein